MERRHRLPVRFIVKENRNCENVSNTFEEEFEEGTSKCKDRMN